MNLVQSPARRERNLSMLPALFFRHIPVSLLVLVDMQLRSELVTKNDQTASKVAKSISVFSLVDSGGAEFVLCHFTETFLPPLAL